MSGQNSPPKAAAVCLGLAAVTFAVFGQTLTHGFVDFDDNQYVYENPVVAKGLTFKGVAWALTENRMDHWHPLTWLSHMMDCQMYGLRAGGHHLTNVALQAAAAIFLFLALREMTGSLWRSAFMAGIFAIHPLRVESVAWISERKDVLSGVFFMLTLWAYARYARHPSRWRYAAVVAGYGIGLLCKNTLVTLPFVLLLLDWWPLHRAKPGALVREKIPLFLMSAGSCLLTLLAPQKIAVSAQIAFFERLANALVSYSLYLGQLVFPARLAIPYLYPPNGQPFWKVVLASVLLAAISISVWAVRKKRPYLLVGWLWYLGILVPMSGIVQISYHAHADRFTYLPGIGLVLAGTWAAGDWSAGWKHRRVVLEGLAVVVMGALMICAWKQTGYWQNSEVLARHTLACAPDNYVAHLVLGNALLQKGNADDAKVQYEEALQTNPNYAQAHNNLGTVFLQEDRVAEAMSQFQQAVQIQPDYTQAHENLGNALMRKGRVDEAITHYQQAVQIYPAYAEGHENLGDALMEKGRADGALAHFRQALQLEPANSRIQKKLSWAVAVASLRKREKAVEPARHNQTLTDGENPVVLQTFAAALAKAGRFSEAVETTQDALRVARAQSNTELIPQLQRELKLFQAGGLPAKE